MTRRTPTLLPLFATVVVLLFPSAAAAVALGEVLSLSTIGEPLQVDLRLSGGSVDEAGQCLRIVPGAVDAGPWVERARISAAHRRDGGVISITSPVPATEPVLKLGIEDACDSRLRREYTLLLPFPEQPSLPRAAAPVAARAAQPRTPPAPAPAPGSQRQEGYQQWTAAAGESLDGIAQALYPEDRALQERFIAATARANPELFPGGDARSRPLPAGTEVLVPPPGRVTAPPPARQAAARPAPRPAPALARPESPRPMGEDRLLVSAATPSETEGAPATALRLDPGANADDRERQIVAAVDRSIHDQVELLERIRELERVQAALIARANQLGVDIPLPPGLASRAEPQPAPEPAPAPLETSEEAPAGDVPRIAPPPPVARESGSDWPTYLVLFVAVIAGILGLQRLQGRRRQQGGKPLHPSRTAAPAATPARWPEETRATAGLETARTATPAQGPAPTQTAPPTPQPGYEWAVPSVMPLPAAVELDSAEEHESAVELAEIMMSFGRVQGAAETLAEFIRGNPRQAVQPWLKLLDVYRAAGMRAEFDGLARQLNKTFNVKAVTWDNYDEARAAVQYLEDMPHIIDELARTWGTPESQAYVERLLRDNREGTRQGFPLSVVDELLLLSAVLEDELGRYKPLDKAA
ncbi:type IV pilus assembly protein FimV [Pseudothauera rhizosphaerae]|uniref:Type 4 pilus biogenesis n=1 Tax=Pseudothauera rhizosphaerae TaxID=2565932 RepID=A0A4S4AR88_9RHOO|nr:hypothetical protein [Pseudothauera rhizosphaerae]THF61682.1 hypothetical protein E6O51_09545 [Pseudothauera rhizosphaerae]